MRKLIIFTIVFSILTFGLKVNAQSPFTPYSLKNNESKVLVDNNKIYKKLKEKKKKIKQKD